MSHSQGDSVATDFITSSIPENPTTKTGVYLQKLYTCIENNRDELGYPHGSKVTPYLFVSNDLSGKYFQTLKMFIDKKLQFNVQTFLDILKSLIETYEEHGDSQGCCGFYFSHTKEQMMVLYDKLNNQT
jgi:hypothetical protein